MEHRSVWLATAELDSYPAPRTNLDADVAVVGGGIVGWTTALLAVEDGARVAVLEARRVASGMGGRTTSRACMPAAYSLLVVGSDHETGTADTAGAYDDSRTGFKSGADQR